MSWNTGMCWMFCLDYERVYRKLSQTSFRRIHVMVLPAKSSHRYDKLIHFGLYDIRHDIYASWWRHQIEKFSALLAICAGNSPVTGEFPSQRPVTRSFVVFFYLRLNKWLSKQSIYVHPCEKVIGIFFRHNFFTIYFLLFVLVFLHDICEVVNINSIDFCWISITGYTSATFWKQLLGGNPMSH